MSEDASAAWEVAGDSQFPVNNGQLYIKGWTSASLLGHAERLTTPLLRTTTGTLAPVGWDEALDFVADHFRRIKETHGPQAIGLFGSGALSNEKAYLLGKFARLAVGTPHMDYNGRYCMSSAAGAGNKAFGIDRGMPFPVSDIADAEVILLVGANTADTLPPIMQWFDRQKANGGRLIVADPRRTATARTADLHLSLVPGSDLALANGLLFIAIEERLINEPYIAARTVGFEAVRRAVLTYDPPTVE